MEMFEKWLAELPTDELMNMVVALTTTITSLKDKPYCTTRQKEEIEKGLLLNQIILQLAWEELNTKRELAEDKKEELFNMVTK